MDNYGQSEDSRSTYNGRNKTETLRTRIESDLSFSQKQLKNDFRNFMAHCLKLSDAFQLLDVGPAFCKTHNVNAKETKNMKYIRMKDQAPEGSSSTKLFKEPVMKRELREAPLCLYEPQKNRGVRHYLRDCPDCPKEEKKKLLDDNFAERGKDGPAANTRARQRDGNVGRIPKNNTTIENGDTSCSVILADGKTTITATGRCDDGSDDTIISPKMAERAAIAGIGKISSIVPVTLQAALMDGEAAQTFKFYRTWSCSRVVLQLGVGKFALLNVTFLVADGNLSTGDPIIGLPVL